MVFKSGAYYEIYPSFLQENLHLHNKELIKKILCKNQAFHVINNQCYNSAEVRDTFACLCGDSKLIRP